MASLIRNNRDFWTGLIYLFFGVVAIVVSRDYSMGTGGRMGPGYFPTILGYLLVLIGGIAVIRSFITHGAPIGAFSFKGLVLVGSSILLFGVIVRGAGVAIALPLLIIISASASAKFRWLPTLLIAAGLTIFCILVFIKGLGIPLPVIGTWLGG